MNKYILTALALLAATTAASARYLSPEEALGRLATGSDAMRAPASVTKSPKLVYSAKSANLERVYVFGNAANRGYMVVSADDVAPALLAYSDSETLDIDNMPDNMRYWLDEYARQIAYAAQNAEGDGEPAGPQIKQRPDVAPKLTTLWDQMEPYNMRTPTVQNLSTPTGCVATALAQIMNWHQWPVQPKGQKSYTCTNIGKLSIDYDRITFEWDKMLDRYYSSSPEENIDAVSWLMIAVGYACEMSYARGGSGASGFKAALGMTEHFSYSKALTLENRNWYGIEEWADLVYDELTTNGPVYYEGSGTGGGHAFVCDGYESSTGFFHFNWGWTGKGNGYYRLSALNPDYAGVGGSLLGYNYSQDIIKGLKKAPEGVEEDYTYTFAPRMGIKPIQTEVKLGERASATGYDTSDGFMNYSLVTVPNVEFGLRFHNVATGVDKDILSNNGKHDFAPNYITNVIVYNVPADLEEGEYLVSPLWRHDEQAWQTMREQPGTRNDIKVTVKDGVAHYDYGENKGRIEIELLEGPEFYTTVGEFTVSGTMKATGSKDFRGTLTAVFLALDKDGIPQVVDQGYDDVQYEIMSGTTTDFEYTSYPRTQKNLVDGADYYYIAIGNTVTGELVSPYYPIKVGNRYGKLQMSTYNFKVINSNFLDPENVSVTAMVNVKAGVYNGPLALGYSLTKDPFEPIRFTIGDDIELIAGDDKQITITGILDDVEAGDMYYTHLLYKDKDGQWAQLSNYPVIVSVGKSYSGVENVATGEDEAEYYDTFGRKGANPSPGSIYIRVTPQGSKKVIF